MCDCRPNWILLFVIALFQLQLYYFPLFAIGCVQLPPEGTLIFYWIKLKLGLKLLIAFLSFRKSVCVSLDFRDNILSNFKPHNPELDKSLRRLKWAHVIAINSAWNYTLITSANVCIASPADILRRASRVPSPRTSPDLSGKKRRPITADFRIWEVHFGPWEISRLTL